MVKRVLQHLESARGIHYSTDLSWYWRVIVSNSYLHTGSAESCLPHRFIWVNSIVIFNKAVLGLCVYNLKSFIIQHGFPSWPACAVGIAHATVRLSPFGRYEEAVTGMEWRKGWPSWNFLQVNWNELLSDAGYCILFSVLLLPLGADPVQFPMHLRIEYYSFDVVKIF